MKRTELEQLIETITKKVLLESDDYKVNDKVYWKQRSGMFVYTITGRIQSIDDDMLTIKQTTQNTHGHIVTKNKNSVTKALKQESVDVVSESDDIAVGNKVYWKQKYRFKTFNIGGHVVAMGGDTLKIELNKPKGGVAFVMKNKNDVIKNKVQDSVNELADNVKIYDESKLTSIAKQMIPVIMPKIKSHIKINWIQYRGCMAYDVVNDDLYIYYQFAGFDSSNADDIEVDSEGLTWNNYGYQFAEVVVHVKENMQIVNASDVMKEDNLNDDDVHSYIDNNNIMDSLYDGSENNSKFDKNHISRFTPWYTETNRIVNIMHLHQRAKSDVWEEYRD